MESFDISGIEQLPQQTRLLTGGRPSSPKKIQRPSSKANPMYAPHTSICVMTARARDDFG